MSVPQHFAESELARLHDAIRAHPFGVIASLVDGRLTATHIHFLLAPGEGPNGALRAHMAALRAEGEDALAAAMDAVAKN